MAFLFRSLILAIVALLTTFGCSAEAPTAPTTIGSPVANTANVELQQTFTKLSFADIRRPSGWWAYGVSEVGKPCQRIIQFLGASNMSVDGVNVAWTFLNRWTGRGTFSDTSVDFYVRYTAPYEIQEERFLGTVTGFAAGVYHVEGNTSGQATYYLSPYSSCRASWTGTFTGKFNWHY